MLCVPPGDASVRRLNRAWCGPHATPLEGLIIYRLYRESEGRHQSGDEAGN